MNRRNRRYNGQKKPLSTPSIGAAIGGGIAPCYGIGTVSCFTYRWGKCKYRRRNLCAGYGFFCCGMCGGNAHATQ